MASPDKTPPDHMADEAVKLRFQTRRAERAEAEVVRLRQENGELRKMLDEVALDRAGIAGQLSAAEVWVERLREALRDLLVHIPNGTAVDPYKQRAYEVLALVVSPDKPPEPR